MAGSNDTRYDLLWETAHSALLYTTQMHPDITAILNNLSFNLLGNALQKYTQYMICHKLTGSLPNLMKSNIDALL